ncbi:7141_t:CDS:1 [Ambispora leptoticha]|uniref:7141_t:CDS:1 n=1 Tax=Ambispora leptoticha TaxID=144679 RepID=A0A9N8VZV6_9GLOM|nr:7141_t:CDS:1 [Ambispora leptoticha]
MNSNYMTRYTASYLIEKLQLQPHPEGGYYLQIYQDKSIIKQSGLPDKFDGDRSCLTSIYYLLEGKDFSAFHRIKSDEVWHYYTGSTGVKIYEIKTDGELIVHQLGQILDKGEKFVSAIEKSSWCSAELSNPSAGFALVGCTVAPGFEYQDLEIATFKNLSEQFPQHTEIIKKLTRN